ncbi:IS66 family transposase [Candidatus Woesearchaeota archaeon]|nr:IS66 family transposase [Candidatus Woesearchaeota archaeon]
MVFSVSSLPDNIPQDLQKVIEHRDREYQFQIKFLEEQVRLLQDKLYGRKAEKLDLPSKYNQMLLFNEAEDIIVHWQEDTKEDQITIPKHTRKKPGRRPLPENLPRIEVIPDLSEEEKECGCGSQMIRIGEEISEKLDIIPAKFRVIRHIRYKYACRNCEGVESEQGAVKTAPLPLQLIPRSIVTPGLAAHILVSKFVDALPFYRQAKQFERIGVEVSRATMSTWAIQIAEKCNPLLSLLHSELLSGPLINIDETTVQVLDEPGRSNTTKSYMWVFRGGPLDKSVLIFQYHPTRSGQVPIKFLKGYSLRIISKTGGKLACRQDCLLNSLCCELVYPFENKSFFNFISKSSLLF